MKVVIIEDEHRAAQRLEKLIQLIAPEMEVVERIDSVRDAIEYFENHQDYSLIFSDIQLADGLCFKIFENVKITCPVIFTTAYDKYAIDAFKANGIDYLLKPIEEDRLKQAIQKLKNFTSPIQIDQLFELAKKMQKPAYKSRFMIKVGEIIKSIGVDNILLFYSLEKATFLLTNDRRSYVVDHSLDHLDTILDPDLFFRINRKYILSIKACTKIHSWTNSRLTVIIEGFDEEQIIVARERVRDFKVWLDR